MTDGAEPRPRRSPGHRARVAIWAGGSRHARLVVRQLSGPRRSGKLRQHSRRQARGSCRWRSASRFEKERPSGEHKTYFKRFFPSSPRRGGCAIKQRREASLSAQTGWCPSCMTGNRSRFEMDSPPLSAPPKEASRHLIDVAATPPRRGGEKSLTLLSNSPFMAAQTGWIARGAGGVQLAEVPSPSAARFCCWRGLPS